MAGASMNDIKARIKSVEGTMQITKAMELVATSKLRHAKLRAERAKPYMNILSEAINNIARSLDGQDIDYLKASVSDAPTLFIVIAGDRGLAGGYNNNVFKLVSGLDKAGDGLYVPIGKKALDFTHRMGRSVFSDKFATAAGIGVGDCLEIADEVCKAFLDGKISEVKLIYTEFVSMLTQAPKSVRLLPVSLNEAADGAFAAEPIFEGDAADILGRIIPQYVGGALHAAICESVASECGARRMAMNSANKNAEEMIGTLTLKFNRARQAVITQEITEIVSGAEAL